MKKFRACLEVATLYVRTKLQKRNDQIEREARELTWLHETYPPPSDDEDRWSDDSEGSDDGIPSEDEEMEIVPTGPLVVRSISGKVVHSQKMAGNGMRVADIIESVCESTEARVDEVHLLAGESVLANNMILGKGECVSHPGPGQTLELSVAVVAGPPVIAESSSGRRIEVLDGVPECGDDCHFDRDYVFTSLGDFAETKGMRYIQTSNEDRKMPANRVMWRLDIREPVVVFVNFRSEGHLQRGGALEWLQRDGWELKPDFKSTVSSGYPNGPYVGPVYAKSVQPQNRMHLLDLMGSNCWEGTYFVFVQVDSVDSVAIAGG